MEEKQKLAEAMEEQTVDEVMHKAGDFGRFQLLQMVLLSSLLFIASVPVLMMYFAADNPPWLCQANTTCSLNGTFSPASSSYSVRCNLPRSAWKYTTSRRYSIVTQFDLFCDNEWIIHILKSVVFIGWAFGGVLLGLAADRIGRKKILFLSTAAIFVASVLMAFCTNVWLIVALQFIRGFFNPGTSVIAFVMASELVGHRWRPLSGIGLWLVWTIAICLLGAKAYFIRNWKTLTLICTLPYTPVLFGIYFVPESIRWLRLCDREDEAVKILQKIGRINKRPIGDVKLVPVQDDERETNSTYMDIFRPTPMLIKTAIQWFAWLSCGLVYYGVTFASDDLGGSMHRDYILASLVEFPAIVAAIYLCGRLGRKPTIAYPMFVTAVVLIIVSVIPEDSNVKFLRVVFGIIGKFCITVSFDAIYTWSVELYPTSVRSKGMGNLQVAARVGSAAAPWIAKALRVYHVTIPFIVMAVFSFATGIVLLWLPETRGKQTLETLNDLNTSKADTGSDAFLKKKDSEDRINKQYRKGDENKELVMNVA